MNNSDICKKLQTLFDKMDESSSMASTYSTLDEIEKFIESHADSLEPADKINAYIDIAYDGYYPLGHYLNMIRNYEKAFAVLDGGAVNIADIATNEESKDLWGNLEYHLGMLLKIYKKTGKEKEAADLLIVIQKVMPDSFDKIKKKAENDRGLKRDPVEYTEKYMAILPELETKIEKRTKDIRRTLGSCFIYWDIKKEILKKDYGIEWKSPATLNPGVKFD